MSTELEKSKSITGKRKYYFFLIVFAIVSVLQAAGKLPADGKAFESIIWAIILGFGGGNVGEHFAKRGNT